MSFYDTQLRCVNMTEFTVKQYDNGDYKVLISATKKIFINNDNVQVIVLHPLFEATTIANKKHFV